MRRLTSTVIVLVALLIATVAAAPGVSAQDTAEHPAVGAWLIDSTPADTTDPLELLTVAPGGIVVSATPGAAPGYGSWAPTGDRSADATILIALIDQEGGFVGYLTARTSIEVAEDGASLVGTYTIEFPAGMAEAMGAPAGQLGPGEITGQRIAVEPPGEPVGPLPEEQAPAPGGSPAPVQSTTPVQSLAPDGSPPAPEASPTAPEESPAA